MIKSLKAPMIDDSAETGAELVEATSIEKLQRAEIDVQVATAKRWPREIDKFKRRAIALATLDDETAESCLYRRPVGKENGKEVFAEGMSIRMAEIVGASYGNLRVAATIIEQTERKVVARGMAFDLEANFASSSEVVESTVTKTGAPYSERMRVVIAKSALAKARRDATFQVVPRAIAKPVEEAVKQLLMGNAESLEKRRSRVVGWISKLGIDVKRVYAALGINGPSDLTSEELEKLTGIKTAIKDGEVGIDEAFPELPKKMKLAAGVSEVPEDIAPKTEPQQAQPEAAPISQSPQQQLQALIEAEGFTFTDLQAWGEESGNIPDASSLPDYNAIPDKVARRLLLARKGLIDGLRRLKGEVAT